MFFSRLLLLGLLLGLAYRVIRDVLKSLMRGGRPNVQKRADPKSSARDLDRSRIRDAEFRDLDDNGPPNRPQGDSR